jgi:uncharacterized membrane protein YbhN (UPF0104 family)
MKRYLSVILQYVVFLGLGVFLIWWTTRKLTDEEVGRLKDALFRARYVLVLPAILMLLMSHYSRALRWRILMEPLGIRPGKANTFFAVMLGYFFNLLVPRLGEVMKCTTLARYEKTPVDRVIGTMVAERGIDFLCLVIVIGLTILLQADLAGPFVQQELRKTFSGESGPAGYLRFVAFLALLVALIYLVRWLFRRYPEQKLIRGIRNMAMGIWQGLTSIRHVRQKKAFILHTVFIWTMYLMSIRLGFLAMNEVQHLGIRPSMTILSTGSLAMIATQGGIGAYQYAVEKSLQIYGIGAVAGLAYGWLLWAVQTLMVMVVGLLCLILLPYYNRNKK